MIHGVAVGWVWVRAERGRHKTADKIMMGFTVAGQGDTLIPFVIGERFQDAFLFVFLAFDAP